MSDGAELRLATDDMDYALLDARACAIHPAFEWLARRPGDWRERPVDWPPTRYEQKALAAGRRPAFLRVRCRPRWRHGGRDELKPLERARRRR